MKVLVMLYLIMVELDLNNITLRNNFDEDDTDILIFIRLFAWHIKFRKHKELKMS